MNLNEFAALKVGDKVENAFTHSVGEVTDAMDQGVRVRWSESSQPFFYSVAGTSWFHWSKQESKS